MKSADMQGYLSLILHAHLPFVRHPEHELFLEENWLFEAITESYIPLLQVMERWIGEGVGGRLTLTLTPTLCAMLRDSMLQDRYTRHLERLLDLAEEEIRRTHWDGKLNGLALMYRRRLEGIRDAYCGYGKDLVGAFRKLQDLGRIEIITSAATHAVLPLLASHPPSVRAQVRVACDEYRACFGREPRGMWLPECAYMQGLEEVLKEAGLIWFITDTHGILHANPRPRYGVYAPMLTPAGVAAFGRDRDSARQVWSRQEGYPGDPRYRDFYRDIGFDLELNYLKPYLPSGERSFTGIKYHRITGGSQDKDVYDREAALAAAAGHAQHFVEARIRQALKVAPALDRPPLLVAPYDAELFGHWWYEGPEFLDGVARKACFGGQGLRLITPGDYLEGHSTHQVGTPSASSWGEEGYWRVWLNEVNEWILPHLHVAQERMTELVRRYSSPGPIEERALRQAGRELLLAQASDWPFILRTGTSPDYAAKRVKDHLLRFLALYDQLTRLGVDTSRLEEMEQRDNLFPEINYRYWEQSGT